MAASCSDTLIFLEGSMNDESEKSIKQRTKSTIGTNSPVTLSLKSETFVYLSLY